MQRDAMTAERWNRAACRTDIYRAFTISAPGPGRPPSRSLRFSRIAMKIAAVEKLCQTFLTAD
jgi:hypothetical protein